MKMRLEGAMTALVTPLRGGAVDEEALRALIERQLEGGIQGLVPVGTTGESATLDDAERLRVIQITVEQVRGRVPVIAGTGSNDTRQSVAFTRLAREVGADAALVVCPPYNKPNQEGLFQHFKAVGEAGLPVVLYNVPGRTVVSLTAATVGRLAALERVVAIKEATANLQLDTEMMEAAQDRITFLSGDDFTTFPFCAIGGHGCISVVSNLDPALVVAAVKAGRAGDVAAGLPLHRKLNRLGALCFADANPTPIKALLADLGLCADEVRLPLVPPSAALRERLRAGLAAEGYAAGGAL